MSFKKKSMLALAVVGLLGCDLVEASLVSRGGGMIYDTALNITWLQDANFAKSSAHSVDGLMTWADAMSWVSNLNFGGGDDWRLPSAFNYDDGSICWGWGCSKSEMGHLFYEELGLTIGDNMGFSPLASYYFNNIPSGFISIQYGVAYWTASTVSYYYPETMAYNFETVHGNQRPEMKSTSLYAWAVHDGDLAAATSVPEPNTLTMILAGLCIISGFSIVTKIKPSV